MSEAPRTRIDLIDKAIENLGVLVEGQAVTAAMRQKVDRIFDGHIAELRIEEIVYVADIGTPGGTSGPPTGGEIPAEYFNPLSHTLAWAAAPGFSLAGDPSLATLDQLARDTLRRLTKPARTRRTLRVDPALRMQSRVTQGNFTEGS